ncbi:MAG: CPBP family intramembrane metalloprotease [Methanosarcinales archaeon]|jgi:membrane protease YdiL (CAAX protease family)|nr:CPBP family intramembrane metalloprotease [Methanosarcinales archaeon]
MDSTLLKNEHSLNESLIHDEKRTDKKSFKKGINRLSLTLTIYELMMVAGYIFYSIFLIIQNPDISDELFTELSDAALGNGWIIMAGVAVGLLFILLLRKKDIFSDLTKKNRSMTLPSFIKILFCFMSAQILFVVFSTLFESFLNVFGYTNLAAIEEASSASLTFSLFLYAGIAGPLTEEIVFRGAALRYLEKYGKVFAIIVSALLFGVFHGNLMQGFFAFAVGLVLGYVALEFSFKWAVVLHILNNLVFSELLGRFLELLDPSLADMILYALYTVFFAGGVLVLYIERKRIQEYLSSNRSNKTAYLYAFTAFWMIVYIAINFVMAFMGITPLVN